MAATLTLLAPAGAAAQICDVTLGILASTPTCTVGQACQVAIDLLGPPDSVAAAVATIALSPEMTCVAPCTNGPTAPNADCTMNAANCRFSIADTLPPITTFTNGAIALIDVLCDSPGTFVIDLLDQSASNTMGSALPNLCTASGQVVCEPAPVCGNNIIESGEQCEDGNTQNGDCCSSTCQFEAAATVCRAAAGICDVAETCTGASATCPVDAKSRAQCRGAADVCDVAEICDGTNDACPVDAFAAPTTECRAAGGICDVAELCTGASVTCPIDAKSTAQCRGSAGICDVAETCDGINDACPVDAFAAPTTECRAAGGICDVAELCTGAGATCPTDAKSTAQCRGAADVCDAAETCDGINDACPVDAFAAPTTECRAAGGICDVAELCTGASVTCPIDAKSTAQCRGSAGICDVAETCDGINDACPVDAFAAPGAGCGSGPTDCSGQDTCDGVGICQVHDFGAGVVCSDDGNLCTDDVCDGIGICGHPDNAAPCDDIDACTQTDTCSAGVCVGTNPVLCTDTNNPCTDNACDPLTGCTITSAADGTACSDDQICTDSDLCLGGQCVGVTIAGCCLSSADCDDSDICTLDECLANACINTTIDADQDGFTTCAGDCDDNDPARSPGLLEVSCNGIDDDCTLTTNDTLPGGCLDCVSLTLPEPVLCHAGRDCSVPVAIDTAGLQIATAAATVLTTVTGLTCPDTTADPSSCALGAQATNATCTAGEPPCRFEVSDTALPIDAFGNGELARLSLQCSEPGTGVLCLQDAVVSTTDDTPAPACGPSCVSFECGTCVPGDCNQTGGLDAGDAICTVLCVIGNPTPGADCLCAADCNCTGGLEAADLICTVLRMIEMFEFDTCGTIAPPAALTALMIGEGAVSAETVRLQTGAVSLDRSQHRVRTQLRLAGAAADDVAVLRAMLWTGGASSHLKLTPRLARAGFTMHVQKDGGHAVVLITPPLRVPIMSIGRGRVLRVTQPVSAPALAITAVELGRTDGRLVR